jgi:tRNA pseudouridine55 synthase
VPAPSPDAVRDALARFTGVIEQAYPPFSSARVRGRPLYQWAREGRLREVDVPTARRTVYAAELLGTGEVTARALAASVERRVALVRGAFRQDAVLARWLEVLSRAGAGTAFGVARLRIECSAGTYMRSLAHELGRALGTAAVADRIVRTRAGAYSLADAVRLACARGRALP